MSGPFLVPADQDQPSVTGPVPVAHWPFEEGTGSVTADITGNGHTGTFIDMNGSGWATGRPGGSSAHAVQFDGTNGPRIDVANPDPLGFPFMNPFSVTYHIFPRHYSNKYVISKMQGLRGWGHQFFRQSNLLAIDLIMISSWSANVLHVRSSAFGAPLNQWSHIATTYDGSLSEAGVKTYIDGILIPHIVLKDGLVESIDNAGPFSIGVRELTTSPVDAIMDDVRVYDIALSEPDVSQIANEIL